MIFERGRVWELRNENGMDEGDVYDVKYGFIEWIMDIKGMEDNITIMMNNSNME